jgi:hypothetical protein
MLDGSNVFAKLHTREVFAITVLKPYIIKLFLIGGAHTEVLLINLLNSVPGELGGALENLVCALLGKVGALHS